MAARGQERRNGLGTIQDYTGKLAAKLIGATVIDNPDMTNTPAAPTANDQRKILLCVTGLSPQVVTETLYALAVSRDEPFIPEEIHLLTTAEGAERARLALLSDEPGWFEKLRVDYDLPNILFNQDSITVLSDKNGSPLSDIRSPADNAAAADTITELVRKLTEDSNTALHVSIAGGRKTMGFYLGYALSLYGREQDELSHILVSEEFESSWNFFYPTPYSQIIEVRDQKLADTRTAKVTLAEIPFVSLRHGLPQSLLNGSSGFSDTVDAARQSFTPGRLQIDKRSCQLICGTHELHLKPAEFAFYMLFVNDLLKCGNGLHYKGKTDLAAAILDNYRPLVGADSADAQRLEEALQKGMSKDYFDQRKSKTNRALRQALGYASQHYEITLKRAVPFGSYGLYGLNAANVRFVCADNPPPSAE